MAANQVILIIEKVIKVSEVHLFDFVYYYDTVMMGVIKSRVHTNVSILYCIKKINKFCIYKHKLFT